MEKRTDTKKDSKDLMDVKYFFTKAIRFEKYDRLDSGTKACV